jgi:hypothetical protein
MTALHGIRITVRYPRETIQTNYDFANQAAAVCNSEREEQANVVADDEIMLRKLTLCDYGPSTHFIRSGSFISLSLKTGLP